MDSWGVRSSFEVRCVHSSSKCSHWFEVGSWWFEFEVEVVSRGVHSEFEVEVVSRGFTVVCSGSRWFTVVRSVLEVEMVRRGFTVGLKWFEVVSVGFTADVQCSKCSQWFEVDSWWWFEVSLQ